MVGLVKSYRGLNRCVLFANRVVIGWRKYKNNKLPIPYSTQRKYENNKTDYFWVSPKTQLQAYSLKHTIS